MRERPGETSRDLLNRSFSRRQFLTASAAAAAALGVAEWTPAFRVPAGAQQSTLPMRPNFPPSIGLVPAGLRELVGRDLVLENAWTCAPESDAQVVALANWAYPAAYQVRARGMMHNWSPLVLPVDSSGANLFSRTLSSTSLR